MRSIVLATLLCAACDAPDKTAPPSGTATRPAGAKAGGTSAAGSTTAPAGASRLVYKTVGPDKKPTTVEVSGAALARQLNDGRFVIYVYSADIDPKPTCDLLKPADRMVSKGAEIGLAIHDFAGKAGKVKAKEAIIDYHKPSGEGASEIDLHGPDVDIRAYDGKTLRATVVTPDPPTVQVPRVDGSVVATVCPPQK